MPDESFAEPPAPVEPFGTRLGQVEALIPNVDWIAGDKIGQTGVTADQALDWIGDLSARVEIVLARWTELASEGRKTAMARLAADAVAHGAASYASAASSPEQVGKAELAYHQVLWNRHVFLLEQAALQLTDWLNEQDDKAGGRGAVGTFPAPSVCDGIGF